MIHVDRFAKYHVLAVVTWLAVFLQGALAEPVLSSVTTSPSDNFFPLGGKARTILTVKGAEPDGILPVVLTVFDFTRTNVVAESYGKIMLDGKGNGSSAFDLPTGCYGIFYVSANAGGLTLPKVGTGPKGFFSYGVLEDPAKMPDIDPWDAFLGEHNVASRWLWSRGGFNGTIITPYRPSTNRLVVASLHRACGEHKMGGKRFWTIATNESVQAEYRDNLVKYVKDAIKAGVGRQGRRIYEPLWEPNLTAPTPESIVAAQKIAWETIHALDPEALVGAYTSSGINLGFLRVLMDLGLGRYMNAMTVHPYKGMPETGGYIDDIRGMKRILREYMGRDVPIFATEAGMNTENTIDGDRRKLCGQLRQAIILFGEGFQMYFPFFDCDYGADLNNQGNGDYGLQYNSQYPKVRFGCKVSQPRPIFGARAAFGRLTEGRRPTCTIEWLAETVLGYAFADKADEDVVVAIWDWGGHNTKIHIPVGGKEIDVADVMGNMTRMSTDGGKLELTLSEYPQYILRADPAIWGRAAQSRLKWSERRFKSANDLATVGVVSFTPAFDGETPGIAVTLANRTEKVVPVTVEARIPGEPDCRRKSRTSVPANGEKRITIAFEGFNPPPTSLYETTVRVVPDEGMVFETKDTFNFMRIPGKLSFGESLVEVSADSTALRLDVTTKDSTPQNDMSGWWSWNGDALQIALARKWLSNRTENDVADACNQAYCEYTVAKTPNGAEVCRTITWDPRLYPCDSGAAGLVGTDVAPRSVTHDGTNWHYSVALPWEFINLHSPKAGTVFRMALQSNDRVPDDRALHSVECFKMKLAAPKNFGWFVIGE